MGVVIRCGLCGCLVGGVKAVVGLGHGNQRGGRKRDAAPTHVIKKQILGNLGRGMTIVAACAAVDRSRSSFDYYVRNDREFAAAVDRIRSLNRTKERDPDPVDRVTEATVEALGDRPEKTPVPPFPEFCEQYLGQKLWPHQLQWYDLLEGREPRELHEAMEFREGKKSRIIVNTPPGHAKSTTVTVNYAVWRILQNPSIKIIVVSKAQKLAEQFLLQIKERLTSDEYAEMHAAFAPPGGWAQDSAGWSASRFYVSSKVRGAEAKDPTVQAIGIRGQVYGSRADLIVVDDSIDNTNVMDYEKQINWLLGIVGSRLAPRTGRLLVIGTRIAPTDLYVELQDPRRYGGQVSPWTYLRQPAVLEFHDDPKDWVTLWPHSDNPSDPDDEPDENGMYRRWDGETLAEVRDALPPALWARIYQQEQISEQSYFTTDMITSCTRGGPPGLIADTPMGRKGGMEGLRLIAGLDPAMSGYTAAVLVGFDKSTGMRWVVDIHNQAAMKPDEIRTLIRAWTEKYGIHEWRIEKNAFQSFLTQDAEVRNYLAGRGVVLTDHLTGNNKNDPQFGVAAMTMLFEQGMISLPYPMTEGVRAMREQLLTWDPKHVQSKHALRGHKTDIVMALWMAELRCLELYQHGGEATHGMSQFQTRYDRGRQFVVPSEELELASFGWR